MDAHHCLEPRLAAGDYGEFGEGKDAIEADQSEGDDEFEHELDDALSTSARCRCSLLSRSRCLPLGLIVSPLKPRWRAPAVQQSKEVDASSNVQCWSLCRAER